VDKKFKYNGKGFDKLFVHLHEKSFFTIEAEDVKEFNVIIDNNIGKVFQIKYSKETVEIPVKSIKFIWFGNEALALY
jgi:hypothetical protein